MYICYKLNNYMAKQSNVFLDSNELEVIAIFEKRLESIFFCETKVLLISCDSEILNLNIEISPNFSLTELLSLLKLANFSNHWTALNSLILNFKNEVSDLSKELSNEFDIEEIYISLKNTSITISSINKNSIVDEIIFIVYSIVQHFDNYSGIGTVPSAIHIPIFEDLTLAKGNSRLHTYIDSPYSKYWGLYFDHLEKPMIYDLTRSCIISGDIDLNMD